MNSELALKYVRRKKRRRRVAIISSICTIALTVFIIIAFCLMKVDRFTISTAQEAELSLCIDEDRKVLTTELQAPPLLSANDTQYSDIPENIEDGLGSKNTNHYFAYSFYLLGKASDKDNINYSLSMSLVDTSKDLEQAIRVMIIRDGDRRIYSITSKPIYDGSDHTKDPERELGITTAYWDSDHIALIWDKIAPGAYTKYTIVIWIDGWESVDSMKSGTFSANLKFSTK